MTRLLAWRGTAIKADIIAQLEAHYARDEIVQGLGWDGHRGCSIGCVLHAYDHYMYPAMLGMPVWMARLQDAIHEGLPPAEAREWPLQWARAVPEGIDVEPVRDKVAIRRLGWLLEHVAPAWPEGGYGEQCQDAIRRIIQALRSGEVEAASAAEAGDGHWRRERDWLLAELQALGSRSGGEHG